MHAGAALCCLLAALSVSCLTACGSGTGASGSGSFERADAAKLVLGPRDLGRGYAIGDDSGCGPFTPEEYPDRFMDFMYETRPAGCRQEINYIWGGARTTVVPRAVQSSIIVFRDEADAREAMKLRDDLIPFMVAESPRDFVDLPDFGHEALGFRNRGDDVAPGAGVIWRNGNALAVVFAGGEGMSREEAPKLALGLARKQQERIEHPPEKTSDERMDPELPLDDPTLDVPVYWLGHTFEPGGGLPKLTFGRAYRGAGDVELGFTVELAYGAEGGETEVVKLWVFHPDAYERFKEGVLGRLVTAASCSSATKREIPGGHVVIWAGYAKPTGPPCPNDPYDRYVGYVHLQDAVVAVNQPWGLYPGGVFLRRSSHSYHSVRGIVAIARGLQIRKPR